MPERAAPEMASFEAACADRAAEATSVKGFRCWGRRSMAWGFCRRLRVPLWDAFQAVDAAVPRDEARHA